MTLFCYRQLQRKALLAKWSEVDWSKSNIELADEAGLSRERIRQVRQQLGAPKPTYGHPRMRKSAEQLQWAKDNLEKLKGLSWAEVVRKYGVSRNRWRGPLYQFLRPFLRDGRRIRKYPWHQMNFRLPNRDLERIWRLPYYMVAAYRWRKRRPPPTWRVKPGTWDIQFGGRREVQAYRLAVKAEERNAARYLAQA
jgi:hypothetical protein